MYHNFLIHSFADGHLGCFQYLAIVNCAAMNIGVHRLFWIGVSGFLGYNPTSRIAGHNNEYREKSRHLLCQSGTRNGLEAIKNEMKNNQLLCQ